MTPRGKWMINIYSHNRIRCQKWAQIDQNNRVLPELIKICKFFLTVKKRQDHACKLKNMISNREVEGLAE